MTSLVSSDSSDVLLAISHDIVQMLAGVRHIMDSSIAQDSKLHDIVALLATQTEQIKEKDQSIMVMQSKIDSQQAIIEEIRSEQRLLTSAIASLSKSYAPESPDTSVTLSSHEETPEPVRLNTTAEKPATAVSIPERLTPETRPKRVSNTPSDTDAVARAHLKNDIPGGKWVMPNCYARTQRAGVLRRQGAFYGVPDWHAMTKASGGIPDSAAPPSSPPASQLTEEDMMLTLKKVREDVTIKLEAREKMNTVTTPTEDVASDDGGVSSDTSPRSSPKRHREPDELEKTLDPINIFSIVHDAPDGDSPPLLPPSSPGHCAVQDDASSYDGPTKRRRLSQDGVESPTAPEKKRPTRRSPRREVN